MDQKEIDNFLEENKIRVQGGNISSNAELSLLLNSIAKDELKKENVDKAKYFINKAINFDHKNHEALFIKGMICRHEMKYVEAIESFKNYNKIMNDGLSLIYIGFCYAELFDSNNALDYLNKGEKSLSEEEKRNDELLLSSVYECIGNIYLNRENLLEFDGSDKLKLNYKLAVKNFKKSLKLHRNNHELLNKLAACYYHFEDEGRALYCYEEAAKYTYDKSAYLEVIEEMMSMGITSTYIEF